MSTLIVILPIDPTDASPEYDFVLGTDAAHPAAHGRCPASLLPAPAKPLTEVVALVPARALSWHRVQLPANLGRSPLRASADAARLRAVLAGMLEDQLLDEPEQLHFAVFPGPNQESGAWVAVCNRAWLLHSLQTLEAAQRPVSRIVAEFAPATGADTALAQVSAGLDPAQLALCTAQGVAIMPLGAAAVNLTTPFTDIEVRAEPALAELAEALFKRPVTLQTDVQRWLLAASTPWNLAQFDLAPSKRARWLKTLVQGLNTLYRAPPWRPVRWGLAALLLTHLLGLNALAWKERSLIEEKTAAIRALFVQTFPEVKVVVDAPLQMEREVMALRQATGQAGGAGLVDALTHVARMAPGFQPLDAMELIGAEVRLKGPTLSADKTAAMLTQLSTQGWQARLQGERLVLEYKAAP